MTADDDQGRAFALWRPLPGRVNPAVAFRALVQVGPDLDRLDRALAKSNGDPVARSALRQLVVGWLTPRLQDVGTSHPVFEKVGTKR